MACIELILYFVKNSFTFEKLTFDTLFLPLGSWLAFYKPSKCWTNACPKFKLWFLMYLIGPYKGSLVVDTSKYKEHQNPYISMFNEFSGLGPKMHCSE